MTNVSVTASQRQAARITGLAYVFGILYVPVYVLTSGGLTVAGDPAATFANVQANPVLFRVGIVSTLVMFVSVFCPDRGALRDGGVCEPKPCVAGPGAATA
jgi:Domain of unknown function (DUF4386)